MRLTRDIDPAQGTVSWSGSDNTLDWMGLSRLSAKQEVGAAAARPAGCCLPLACAAGR